MSKRGAPDTTVGQTGNFPDEVQIPGASPTPISVSFEFTFLTSFVSREPAVRPVFRASKPFRGFVDAFDLKPKHEVAPLRHQPGNQFASILRPASWLGSGGMPPYRLSANVPRLGDVQLTVKTRIDSYGPRLAVVQLEYAGVYSVDSLDRVLGTQQQIRAALELLNVKSGLREIAALVLGANLRPLGKVRVHADIMVDEQQATTLDVAKSVAAFLAREKRTLVALHLAGGSTSPPDPRLEFAMAGANSRLNLKSASQHLILNSQGSTLVRAAATDDSADSSAGDSYHNRHERLVMLSSIATAMQHHLLVATDSSNLDAECWAGDGSVLARWIRFPKSVFHTSVSNVVMWETLVSEYGLQSLLDEAVSLGDVAIE